LLGGVLAAAAFVAAAVVAGGTGQELLVGVGVDTEPVDEALGLGTRDHLDLTAAAADEDPPVLGDPVVERVGLEPHRRALPVLSRCRYARDLTVPAPPWLHPRRRRVGRSAAARAPSRHDPAASGQERSPGTAWRAGTRHRP